MNHTVEEVQEAIDDRHFSKNKLRLIQQAYKQWHDAIEASKTGGCNIHLWMEFLARENIWWNQRKPNNFTQTEWYGSQWALSEAGLVEEFLQIRKTVAQEAIRDAVCRNSARPDPTIMKTKEKYGN